MAAGLSANASSGNRDLLGRNPPKPDSEMSPYTSSPGLNFFASLPTDSTRPATSAPSILTLGLKSPKIRRSTHGLPLVKDQSQSLTAGGAHLQQDLIVPGLRLGHFLESKHVRRSESCEDNRFHDFCESTPGAALVGCYRGRHTARSQPNATNEPRARSDMIAYDLGRVGSIRWLGCALFRAGSPRE